MTETMDPESGAGGTSGAGTKVPEVLVPKAVTAETSFEKVVLGASTEIKKRMNINHLDWTHGDLHVIYTLYKITYGG